MRDYYFEESYTLWSEVEAIDSTYHYYDTVDTAVTYNTNQYFSIKCSKDWDLGGSGGMTYKGFVFDMTSGEQVSLDTLFPNSLSIFAGIIWDYYVELGLESQMLSDRDTWCSELGYDDFSFSIAEDGEIIIETKVIFTNAAGGREIPTGFMIQNASK